MTLSGTASCRDETVVRKSASRRLCESLLRCFGAAWIVFGLLSAPVFLVIFSQTGAACPWNPFGRDLLIVAVVSYPLLFLAAGFTLLRAPPRRVELAGLLLVSRC